MPTPPLGPVVPKKKTTDHSFSEAFDIFMNDPARPSLTEVAKRVKMSPVRLTQHAQLRNWERMRANSVTVQTVSQSEKRLNVAKIVDERIVTAAEEAITKATKIYLEVIDHIEAMPLDPMLVPEDELPKDGNGNITSRPKRGTLIENKTHLLNQAMDGFMKMSSGAQGIGLVLLQKGAAGTSAAEDLSKLSKLNVMLLNIQQGSAAKDMKKVEEIGKTVES